MKNRIERGRAERLVGVGQRIRARLPGFEDESFTVIGVVGDTWYGDLTELKPMAYFAFRQVSVFRARHLLMRTDGPGVPVMELAREALQAEAPMYEVLGVSHVQERLDEPLARPRFTALLLSTLALTALVIAVAGVYSVMAFLVRTRRRELGVRIACGGTPSDVGGLVVRRVGVSPPGRPCRFDRSCRGSPGGVDAGLHLRCGRHVLA